MWYDDLLTDFEKEEIEAEGQKDEDEAGYWRELEEFWYQFRPHTIEKDWEDLNKFEIYQLQRDFETFHDLERRYQSSRYAIGE